MCKKISIVIPIYNCEYYLENCIERIIEELSQDCELILINDGSTDNSDIICKKYEKKYDNIIYEYQENQGPSAARNKGILLANGEYIMFVDADDMIEKNGITNMMSVLCRKPDFFYLRYRSFDDKTGKFFDSRYNYEQLKECFLPTTLFERLNGYGNLWFAPWQIVINRSFLIENKLFFKNGIFHEDELWGTQVFVTAKSVFVVEKSIYCYRENRKGSIVNQKNIKKAFDRMVVLDELAELSKKLDSRRCRLILGRCAALEWGIIQDYADFACDSEQKVLYKKIKNNLACLRYKKYYLVYYTTMFLGIKKTSQLWKYIVNKKGVSN